MLKQLSVKDRKMIAIHIKYEKINSYSKLSLSKYCLFLQKSYPTNIYFAMIPSIVHKIKTKNPNKTVNGHYKIVQQITGCQPLKIEATNEQERLDINFTLTKTDLSKIFNLHLATVDKILKRNSWSNNKEARYDDEDYEMGVEIARATTKRNVIIEYNTELRTYYNADDINQYLKDHHHCQNYENVNYNRRGYKYWCNRNEAIEEIGVGKTAFFEHIWGKSRRRMITVSYINYTPFTTKYYLPEIKILKQYYLFKRINNKK